MLAHAKFVLQANKIWAVNYDDVSSFMFVHVQKEKQKNFITKNITYVRLLGDTWRKYLLRKFPAIRYIAP